MSISEIQRFAGDMASNAALRAEAEKYVRSQQSPQDGLLAFAAGKGYAFTADELRQSLERDGKKLSESELDKVAGGGWNIWSHPQLMPLAFLLRIKP